MFCQMLLQVLTQNKLVVANLGDSRCVLGELTAAGCTPQVL